MQIKLYPCFDHWLHNSHGVNNTIWLLSDPHFNDDEMKYLRKNYIGDDELVKRINSKVGKNDTVIFLGDIGDVSYIKRIHGYKVLIMGNHDQSASKFKRTVSSLNPSEFNKLDDDTKELYTACPNLIYGRVYIHDDHLFDEVYDGTLQIAPKIILSHEPVDYKYCFNVHGHDHSKLYTGDNHLNLCVEHIDYTPVNINDIFKSGKLKDIPDIHRETIDNATAKKAQRNPEYQVYTAENKESNKVEPNREAIIKQLTLWVKYASQNNLALEQVKNILSTYSNIGSLTIDQVSRLLKELTEVLDKISKLEEEVDSLSKLVRKDYTGIPTINWPNTLINPPLVDHSTHRTCESCPNNPAKLQTPYIGDSPCEWCPNNPYKLTCGEICSTGSSVVQTENPNSKYTITN